MSLKVSLSSLVVCTTLACLSVPRDAQALLIHGFEHDRHARFELSGYPSAPVVNTNFYQGAFDFSGVGWIFDESYRHITLISQTQFIAARHFSPLPGTTLTFRGRDGLLREYTVADYAFTTNAAGLPSDLAIGELSTPIHPCDKIAWYPPADLGVETNYVGETVLAYGWTHSIGIGTIDGFTNYIDLVGSPDQDINATRAYTFPFFSLSAEVDDCHVANGDSGNPSFIIQNGTLRLIGVHLGLESDSNVLHSVDTFIPHYADQLAGLLTTNISFVDTDMDCLPDAWETNWFGSLIYGPSDDVDHDGLTNRLEKDRDSDPTQRSAPDWWTTHSAIDTNVLSNDFAVVNQGQLKWMATCAAAEMGSVLPIGVGSNVLNFVTNFSAATNFSAVNMGQLIHVGAMFYDRLMQVGQADTYPWNTTQNTNNWAAVNAGQLKQVFSFEISAP
jgi:hypothetical protein